VITDTEFVAKYLRIAQIDQKYGLVEKPSQFRRQVDVDGEPVLIFTDKNVRWSGVDYGYHWIAMRPSTYNRYGFGKMPFGGSRTRTMLEGCVRKARKIIRQRQGE